MSNTISARTRYISVCVSFKLIKKFQNRNYYLTWVRFQGGWASVSNKNKVREWVDGMHKPLSSKRDGRKTLTNSGKNMSERSCGNQ